MKRRTPTTIQIIPAEPGYNSLTLGEDYEVFKQPVIGWAITYFSDDDDDDHITDPIFPQGDHLYDALLYPDGQVDDGGETYASIAEWITAQRTRKEESKKGEGK